MEGSVLGHANAEWSRRPADESFLSLEELHRAVMERTQRAREVGANYATLRTQALDGKVKLIGESNIPADLTWWSFGQLSQRAGAPAGFLRELPATLASQVLNNRLAARAKEYIKAEDEAEYAGRDGGACKLLLDLNGHATVRALTGTGYARIWDSEVTERGLGLQDRGWHLAPVTRLPVPCLTCNGVGEVGAESEKCPACEGDGYARTRGAYASEKDVFMFMVDNERRVFEELPGGGLSRGIMVANSEVGDKSFWMLRFFYQWICGNHNIWGVEGVEEIRVRHTGKAGERAWGELELELKRYAEASAGEDEAKIRRCRAHQLAGSKKELLDLLFGLKSLGLSRRMLEEGYKRADEHSDWYGSPLSAWGIGNGLTELARDVVRADERVELERSAGQIFEMGF